MTKWDKIFLASLIVFLWGTIVFLIGEHLLPGWSQVTLPMGGLLMSASGFVAAISGIALILTTKVRT